jgi:hypothetical protein
MVPRALAVRPSGSLVAAWTGGAGDAADQPADDRHRHDDHHAKGTADGAENARGRIPRHGADSGAAGRADDRAVGVPHLAALELRRGLERRGDDRGRRGGDGGGVLPGRRSDAAARQNRGG